MILEIQLPLAVAYADKLAITLQHWLPWLTNIDGNVLYLHPVFVNFVAAAVPISVIFDIAGRIFGRDTLRTVAAWNMVVAACAIPFTVFFGWLFWGGQSDDDWQMAVHFWLGNAFLFILIFMAVWRWRIYAKGRPPGAVYLGIAVLVLAVLIIQAHLGGMHSFS
ncbi:MAG TPA: DUF2231 domain-containing protein [Phycisphaerae bacterium]|nr:DUF2231 domain-containing protein [Phycisphaerae bacterium]